MSQMHRLGLFILVQEFNFNFSVVLEILGNSLAGIEPVKG